MDQLPLGFDRICRTCMLDSPTLLPLFDADAADTEAARMLASFTTTLVNYTFRNNIRLLMFA